MIRRGTILALTLLAASMATAQGITVQSGDHDGFTRLVARVGADREWQVAGAGRDLRIAFTPDTPEFDLSRVYDLISRDRLAQIEHADGLVLSLACDCEVSVTRYRDSYAVIDIADPPAAPPDPEPAVELPLFTGRADLPQRPGPAFPTPPEAPEPADPPAGFAMEEASGLLAEQLARATAAGLLDPAQGQPLSVGDPLPSTGTAPPTDPAPPVAETPQQPTPPPPINATNAYDLNIAATSDRLTVSAATACLAPPARAIADWPGGMRFLNGLGRLRANAFDERGRLNEDRAIELAELYLANGFGAEAAFWLGEMQSPPAFHVAMAQFIDHRTEGVFGTFADHDLCPEPLLLWLFLSDPSAEPLERTTAAILAQYFELPTVLRDMLGPDLARAFVRADRAGAALEVRAVLVRGGRLSAQDLGFLDLDLPGTPTPPARATTPANAGTARAEPALSHRLLTQIRSRGAVDPADLMAADALVLETDPALTQGGLRHAAALGHAITGDIEGTVSHLAPRGPRDAEAIGPLFAEILSALMELESTAPLLLLLSSDDFEQFGRFPNAAFRRQVAEFLLDRGLPGMARDLILAGGSDHARDRALLSRAFDRLAEDRPDPGAQAAPDPADPDPPIPAETPEDVAALLDESRDLRAGMDALLSQTRLVEPGG